MLEENKHLFIKNDWDFIKSLFEFKPNETRILFLIFSKINWANNTESVISLSLLSQLHNASWMVLKELEKNIDKIIIKLNNSQYLSKLFLKFEKNNDDQKSLTITTGQINFLGKQSLNLDLTFLLKLSQKNFQNLYLFLKFIENNYSLPPCHNDLNRQKVFYICSVDSIREMFNIGKTKASQYSSDTIILKDFLCSNIEYLINQSYSLDNFKLLVELKPDSKTRKMALSWTSKDKVDCEHILMENKYDLFFSWNSYEQQKFQELNQLFKEEKSYVYELERKIRNLESQLKKQNKMVTSSPKDDFKNYKLYVLGLFTAKHNDLKQELISQSKKAGIVFENIDWRVVNKFKQLMTFFEKGLDFSIIIDLISKLIKENIKLKDEYNNRSFDNGNLEQMKNELQNYIDEKLKKKEIENS